MPDLTNWTTPIHVDAWPAFINLTASFMLAMVVSMLYRFTHAGYAYSRGFNLALVGVSMTVCMTMMVVIQHLALSLGLLGAISVIRFRTAVKDPRDLTYLFLSISAGLACAIGAYLLAIMGTVMVCGVLFGMHLLHYGSVSDRNYMLTFCFPSPEGAEQFKQLAPSFFSEHTLRSSVEIDDETFEYVYLVVPKKDPAETIIAQMKSKLNGISRLSLVSPEQLIEV